MTDPADDAVSPGRRVAAIVLAAGRSCRMGGSNKLLEPVGDRPMVAAVTDAVIASGAHPVVVVTGHDRDRVARALSGRRVVLVPNPDHALGMSTSIRAGLSALPGDTEGVLICLGDMPAVSSGDVTALLRAFAGGGPGAVCAPVHGGRRGNPVLWGARFFPELQALRGDTGARELLSRHAGVVREVPVSAGVLEDVDTPDDLDGLRGRFAAPPPGEDPATSPGA